jgi:argininosuccinate synthase
MKKVVLGYSGGLDTSILIRFIKEKYSADIVAVTIGLGQQENLEAFRQKALMIGAAEAFVIDAREEFVNDYILPGLKANALYEGAYPLATAFARPLIVKHLVDIAHRTGADTVAHGCTGKGNDQVRFESALAYLSPGLQVMAPVREHSLSRDYEMGYAKERNIPVEAKLNVFSTDENLWGRSMECGPIEDASLEPPDEAYAWTASPQLAPDKPAYVEITFESGVPTALDGKAMRPIDIIYALNDLGGKHGIGRIDHIESRLIGIKSHETYEAPAACLLIKAHQDLEKAVLTKDVLHFKPSVETTFSELVYNGLWFSPLREAISAFIEECQKYVTGTVRMKLFKGSAHAVGRTSEKSLYVQDLASYEGVDKLSGLDAKGFIDCWALPYKVHAIVHGSNGRPAAAE